MRFVQPTIHLLAKTVPQFNTTDMANWLQTLGCDSATVTKYTDPHSGKTPAEILIELAGRRCYKSFQPGLNPNVQKIREDIAEYIKNIMHSKHGSVLEHYSVSFAIENVSRVFTGEMNRHRAGVAISEGSMRYILYNDIPIVEVDSLIADSDDPEVNALIELDRADIKEHAEFTEKIYERIKARWDSVLKGKDFTKKKHLTSRMRRIIPMGVATGGIWTFNLRALRHMCTMRCSEAAEEEILQVAEMILVRMINEEPVFFGDFARNENGFYQPIYNKV